ncbi:hypothetical protein ACWKWW_01630 [Chryseobacterium cucumeris]
MKNLFSLIIISMITINLKAQELTREQTFQYISSIINSSNGRTNLIMQTGGYSDISDQLFSENEVKHKKRVHMGSSQYSNNTFSATSIPWDALDMQNSKVYNIQGGTTITPIDIVFTGSFNADISRSGTVSYRDQRPMNKMTIYVRNDKVDNIYRALLHLEKVCKVEDPF